MIEWLVGFLDEFIMFSPTEQLQYLIANILVLLASFCAAIIFIGSRLKGFRKLELLLFSFSVLYGVALSAWSIWYLYDQQKKAEFLSSVALDAVAADLEGDFRKRANFFYYRRDDFLGQLIEELEVCDFIYFPQIQKIVYKNDDQVPRAIEVVFDGGLREDIHSEASLVEEVLEWPYYDPSMHQGLTFPISVPNWRTTVLDDGAKLPGGPVNPFGPRLVVLASGQLIHGGQGLWGVVGDALVLNNRDMIDFYNAVDVGCGSQVVKFE